MRLWVMFWVFLCLGVVAFVFDPFIATAASHVRQPLIDTLEGLLTMFITPVVILIAFGMFLFIYQRKELLSYVIAALSSALVAIVLKASVMRIRPFEALELDRLSNFSGYAFDAWNSSFPSWHAAAVFVVLPFIPEKYQWGWVVFAVLYALVRVSTGVHYMSDILFGAAMGLVLGLVCKKCVKNLKVSAHS